MVSSRCGAPFVAQALHPPSSRCLLQAWGHLFGSFLTLVCILFAGLYSSFPPHVHGWPLRSWESLHVSPLYAGDLLYSPAYPFPRSCPSFLYSRSRVALDPASPPAFFDFPGPFSIHFSISRRVSSESSAALKVHALDINGLMRDVTSDVRPMLSTFKFCCARTLSPIQSKLGRLPYS